MTSKLSVEQTISDAYKFGFSRFLSVLGTVWLPYVILAVIVVGLVYVLIPDLPRMIVEHDVDISALMGLGRIAVLISVLGFIVAAMVTVGLQRLALGQHPRPVYVFFSLGMPVWRMAAALFLAGLVVFFIALLTAAAGAAIWFAAGELGGAKWLIRGLAIFAGLAFLLYIALRLFFFLPAVVVAEEKIGIERAWLLGGHNFWRIFIIALAVFVPIAVAFHILSWALFGPAVAWPGGHMSTREVIRALFVQFGTLGPFVLAFQLIERIVILGVFNGAVGGAYRAITGGGVASAAAPATAV